MGKGMVSAVFHLNEETKKKEHGTCTIPKRYIVTLLSFLALVIHSIQRSNMSVVIVAMVNSTAPNTQENDTFPSAECPVNVKEEGEMTTFEHMGERYNFNAIEQSHILGSLFYSYFVAVLLGGFLAKKFGAVRVIGCCILLPSLLELVIPTATSYGLIPLLVVRCLQGSLGGAIFCALNVVISRWSPKMERSRISTIIFAGVSVGTFADFAMAGWICSAEYLGGWPTVFYVSGVSGICWYVFWCFCVYEFPSLHPSISKEELMHLPQIDDNIDTKEAKFPWKSILTSLPVWAVLSGNICGCFYFIIILTELPTYLSKVLHFDIKSSGIFSTLPFIANVVGSLVASQIADKLRQSGTLKITTIRKIFNSISGFTAGISLMAITFCGCRSTLIVGIVTFGMFIEGDKFSGFNVILVDMCPELAGIVYGLCSGIASLSYLVGPLMVGALVANGDTITNWSNVFYATAVVNFVTATFFLLFASAEPQTWGSTKSVEEKDG